MDFDCFYIRTRDGGGCLYSDRDFDQAEREKSQKALSGFAQVGFILHKSLVNLGATCAKPRFVQKVQLHKPPVILGSVCAKPREAMETLMASGRLTLIGLAEAQIKQQFQRFPEFCPTLEGWWPPTPID